MRLVLPLCALLSWALPVPAQAPAKPPRKLPAEGRALRPQQAEATAGEKRVALVVGNGAYQDAPLKNPVNDARAMAGALRSCGFEVQLLVDANRAQLFEAVRAFGQRIKGGGVGFFYYAGHGMAVKGGNYLIPVGVDIATEDEVPVQALDANAVLSKMEAAKNRLNILILDACRNNPFARSFRSGARGLAQMDAPAGSFIAFATSPGSTASDGEGGNGLYTQHLLRTLQQPGLTVEQVFKQVRIGVKQASRDAQVPWDSSSLTGEFVFLPGSGPEPAPLPAPNSGTPPVLGAIRNAVGLWEATFRVGKADLDMILVPPGAFVMGTPETPENKDFIDEYRQHNVTISKPFWMGKYPVTHAQWKAVMGKHPSGFTDDSDLPVDEVSWEDCQRFIARLNGMGKGTFRLPTEAEWEYACLAGTDDVAWTLGTARSRSYPVGQTQPNPFGLYDMVGNIWQWCQDWWGPYPSASQTDPKGPKSGQSRVLRGGKWPVAPYARPAGRFGDRPGVRDSHNGFRVALSVARTP